MQTFSENKLLLVANYAPPAKVGAGVSMYHLISHLPPNSFSILTEEKDKTEKVPGSNYLDVPYYFYSSRAINPAVSDPANSSKKGGTKPERSAPRRFLNRFFIMCKKVPGLRQIGQFIIVARHVLRIVRAGGEAIKKEKPTMLVGYSDGGPVLIASYVLSIRYSVPLSLHFYDLYKGNNLTPVLNVCASIFEPLLLRRAKCIFVMNDLLKNVYSSRAGHKNIVVIYNSLPENDHEYPEFRDDKISTPSIAYLGSIYWAQESALKDLLTAASLLNPRPKVTLYTPYSGDYLNSIDIFESEFVIFSQCSQEDAIKELEKHSLTFLGLSHTSPYRLLINTSSPVRMCDYLYARVPMLVHAPAESFVVKHALAHDFAFVSTCPDSEKLASVLQEALTSKDRDRKVKNANQTVKKFHDPKLSATLFYESVFKKQ